MTKFFAIVLLLVSTSIYAQQQSQSKTIKLDAPCGSQEQLMQMLKKYEERPLLQMLSQRKLSAEGAEYMTIIFANPKKQTYTIVEQFTEDAYCITGSGRGIMPYNGGKGVEQREEKQEQQGSEYRRGELNALSK